MWSWHRDWSSHLTNRLSGTNKYQGKGTVGYTKDGTGYQRKATKKKYKKRKNKKQYL